MKSTTLIFVLAILSSIASAQVQNVTTLFSPDKRTKIDIKAYYKDSTIIFSVTRDNKLYIDTACTHLYFADGKNIITPFTLKKYTHQDIKNTLESTLWERRYQPDNYHETILVFHKDSMLTNLRIRLYNEGFATGITTENPRSQIIKDYNTTYHWTPIEGLNCLPEGRMEDGYYTLRASDAGFGIVPLLASSYTDSTLILINEATNYDFFSHAKVNCSNYKFNIHQNSLYRMEKFNTPWHYVIFSNDASTFIEGKYIIRSLNQQTKSNYSWVKPGKVYRHPGRDTSDFTNSNINTSIDFAQKMKFEYVLLDNGWYGMGYDSEFDIGSDAYTPVSGLNIKELVKYAESKGIGILLYFNKTALMDKAPDSLLTHYKNMGIKGIKIGFIKNKNQMDNVLTSQIITKCATLGLVVNVHDDYRQTGVECLYPNFLTCEGVRGNEYRDNNGIHTTTLPFSRCMTGATDYTICYEGSDSTRLNMPVSKGHQLALSVIIFSPLQHIFWYGMPWWYTSNIETEFFKILPTTWDDFKVFGGFPRRNFTIARRKDNTWYLASITAVSSLEKEIPISNFSTKGVSVTIYQDMGNTIEKKVKIMTPEENIKISLKPNSGCVAIIKELSND